MNKAGLVPAFPKVVPVQKIIANKILLDESMLEASGKALINLACLETVCLR